MNRFTDCFIDEKTGIVCRPAAASMQDVHAILELRGVGGRIEIYAAQAEVRRLRDACSTYLAEHGDHIDDAGPIDRRDIMGEDEAGDAARLDERLKRWLPAEAVTDLGGRDLATFGAVDEGRAQWRDRELYAEACTDDPAIRRERDRSPESGSNCGLDPFAQAGIR